MAKGAPGSPQGSAPAAIPVAAGASASDQLLAQALAAQPSPAMVGTTLPHSNPSLWWNSPNLPAHQRPSQAPAAPAAPALPGSPGAAGTWQAAHSGVRFDANGQPIMPTFNARGAGATDLGSAWSLAGKHQQSPEMVAWRKAYNDPSRPLTQADLRPTWTPTEINA